VYKNNPVGKKQTAMRGLIFNETTLRGSRRE